MLTSRGATGRTCVEVTRRIAPGGFVLFRKGVEVVVAVEPVGRATRTGAAQMQLPQKLRGSAPGIQLRGVG